MTVPTDADIRARPYTPYQWNQEDMDTGCSMYVGAISQRAKIWKYGPLQPIWESENLVGMLRWGALVIGTLRTVNSLTSQLAHLQFWSKDELQRMYNFRQ